MSDDTLASTRLALLREIGPPTDRDNEWQPMVSAGEVRTLLDALDEQAERISEARREGAERFAATVEQRLIDLASREDYSAYAAAVIGQDAVKIVRATLRDDA